MVIFLLTLFCFFIFLFFVYFLAKDDFVIIRKDISLDRVFSLAILTGLFSLFFARLAFAVLNLHSDFINPLVFLAIPYYPGLLFMGGVAGGALFVYIYSIIKKVQVGRLFDLFTMAFIGVLPIGLFFNLFLVHGKDFKVNGIMLISSVFICVFFSKLIFPFSTKGEIKDGSLGFIFLLILSFISFSTNLFLDIKNFSFLNPVNVFTLIVFFTSLILLINQEVMNKYLPKK